MRSRHWFLFFTVLGVLALAAITIPLAYNLRLQLTAARVAGNRAVWRARGPRDYDLQYIVRLDDDRKGVEYHVEVRGGKATSARVGDAPEAANVLTIDDLFDLMDAALVEDAAAGRSNYTVAHFDPRDGHPTHYVRRVKPRKERTEIAAVRLRAVTGE